MEPRTEGSRRHARPRSRAGYPSDAAGRGPAQVVRGDPGAAGSRPEGRAGEILGLLGPNGAGKTSLVSIVAGLRRPDRGRVQVGGVDVVRSPQRARQLIGFAPQDTGVYPTLTVRDNLRFFGGLAGLRRRRGARPHRRGRRRARPRRAARPRAPRSSRVASAAGCTPRSRSCTGPRSSSSTSRRRAPTSARGRRSSSSCAASPTRARRSCTRRTTSTRSKSSTRDVAFIDHGRIVARGTLAELVAPTGRARWSSRSTGRCPTVARVEGAVVDGANVRIPTDDPGRVAAAIASAPGPYASSLRSVEIVRPSLESVFLTSPDAPTTTRATRERRHSHEPEPVA